MENFSNDRETKMMDNKKWEEIKALQQEVKELKEELNVLGKKMEWEKNHSRKQDQGEQESKESEDEIRQTTNKAVLPADAFNEYSALETQYTKKLEELNRKYREYLDEMFEDPDKMFQDLEEDAKRRKN